jgi:hypothetical protein
MVTPGWFAAGGVLGVAADLDAGTLLCTAGGAWTPCFPSALRPGPAVGGALFPIVSCWGGARVRDNLGGDASRPLRHAPPSGEYRPFADDADGQVPRSSAQARALRRMLGGEARGAAAKRAMGSAGDGHPPRAMGTARDGRPPRAHAHAHLPPRPAPPNRSCRGRRRSGPKRAAHGCRAGTRLRVRARERLAASSAGVCRGWPTRPRPARGAMPACLTRAHGAPARAAAGAAGCRRRGEAARGAGL